MSVNLRSKKFVKVNDKLFCVPHESNSIFEIDINTWKTKRLCEIENFDTFEDIIPVRKDDNLYFVNLKTGDIAVFDINSYVCIQVVQNVLQHYIVDIFIFENKIGLIARDLTVPLQWFFIDNYSFLTDKFWEKHVAINKLDGKICNVYAENGTIVATLLKKNVYIKYSLKDNCFEVLAIKNSKSLKCVVSYENYLIFTELEGHNIYILNVTDKSVITIKYKKHIVRVLIIEETIFVIGLDAICHLDVEKHLLKELPISVESMGIPDGSMFMDGFYKDAKFYFLPYVAQYVIAVSEDDFRIHHMFIEPMDIIEERWKQGKGIKENEVFLDCFLDSLIKFEQEKNNNNLKIGEAIYYQSS